MVFVEECKKLLGNFNIYTREEALSRFNWGYLSDDIKNTVNRSIVKFVLLEDDDDIHLSFNNNFWGSKDFNELLRKYGYIFRWVDYSLVVIIEEAEEAEAEQE